MGGYRPRELGAGLDVLFHTTIEVRYGGQSLHDHHDVQLDAYYVDGLVMAP